MEFNKNNLDKASSPYLQQHKDNPIHWQEWSSEVLAQAKKENKMLFVSVGYATCHWCHVMAQDTFSNKRIADYLNAHFIPIKIDREQRPDIDKFLMSFLVQTTGQGGWPLNVFLTPDIKPFFALTFCGSLPSYGMPSFLDILTQLKEAYESQKGKIPLFHPQQMEKGPSEEEDILFALKESFDKEHGGIRSLQKFPPHTTLLFLLHYWEEHQDPETKELVQKTLEIMRRRGLHDHLQGGFFRYCTDAEWHIPHFEKMLYDQAMMLMVYSSSFLLWKQEEDKRVIEKLTHCIEQTFEKDHLYWSAHDADTEHEEGATYLWKEKELQQLLSKEEQKVFFEIYELIDTEGSSHLIKKKDAPRQPFEDKLLKERNARAQPFTDRKIITSWNALLGIGFLAAYRATQEEKYLKKAILLHKALVKKHLKTALLHSSLGNVLQKEEFLEDYAAFLLFSLMLQEEHDLKQDIVESLYNKMMAFKEDSWIEAKNKDFLKIKSEYMDHPIPSPASLAEMALLRYRIAKKEVYSALEYRTALYADFYNIAAFISRGFFHIISPPRNAPFLNLIKRKGELEQCYKGTCTRD